MNPFDLPLKSDKPEEACGVFGLWAPHREDISKLVYFGLFALQHRGQESAGISVTDGNSINTHKEMGLVTQVFTEENLASMEGMGAIGHTRYSTTGAAKVYNAQPFLTETRKGIISLAHNGNLTNAAELRSRLLAEGHQFESSSDSESMVHLIGSEIDKGKNLIDGTMAALSQCQGAFSVLVLSNNMLIAARDPNGFRPLALGKLGYDYVLSSETCGFDIIGARHIRDLEPGELVVITDSGVESYFYAESKRQSLCAFEFIYFARPDSRIADQNMYFVRQRLGRILAREAPAEADVVISVPDSGTPAAIGFAQQSGIPFAEGLVKNRYVGRTFSQPSQAMRDLGIKMKLNPLVDIIKDKRVVVVDDSIVRGSTSKKLVRMLYEAGAKEVHLRISSPPITFPCFFGIDTSDQKGLIAATKSVEEINKYLGSTSLGYLSLDGLIEGIGLTKNQLCLACINGDYPAPVSEELKNSKLLLEQVCGSPEKV